MKTPVLSLASFVGVWILVTSIAGASVVSVGFTRRNVGMIHSRYERMKRATITEVLGNEVTLYAANISVGTPPQSFTVQIDTGSSDLYIMASAASACIARQCRGGTFDPTKSSTFKLVTKNGFKIQYEDQSGSSGDLISDNLGISTALIKSLEMGLAYETTVDFGVMGIGYDLNEAETTKYPNLIDQLVTQGQINAKVYSLWLDDLESNVGSILFGGIDTSKFLGQITVLNVQKDPQTGIYREFLVTATGLSLTGQGGVVTSVLQTSINAVLDSGTSYTYLPLAAVNILVQKFSAVANAGNFYVNCNLLTTQANAYLTFLFGSAEIRVPIQEMVLKVSRTSAGAPFASTCLLAIQVGNAGGPYVFGDTFLRSAYVVYDLDHNQIGLAQSAFSGSSSNIYEIPKDAAGIPPLTGGPAESGSVPASASATAILPTLSSSIVPLMNSVTATSSAMATGSSMATASATATASVAATDSTMASTVTQVLSTATSATSSTNNSTVELALSTAVTGSQSSMGGSVATGSQGVVGGAPAGTSTTSAPPKVSSAAAVSRTLQASNGAFLMVCVLSAGAGIALLGGFGLVVL